MFISGHVKDKEVYLLHGLDLRKSLIVKERSKMETAFTKNLYLNNLESKLLKQHWAPFAISSGATSQLLGQHYSAIKDIGKM